MYTFEDGYKSYHQMKIIPKDQLKTTFTTPWGTFCYIVMSFGVYNVPGTFPCLMKKVFEPFWAFLYEFPLMNLDFIVIELLTLPNLS
jgi:hypothetical protein